MFGLDRVVEEVDAVGREDRSGWSGVARTSRALELSRLIERAKVALLGALADADRDHAWAESGAATAEAWFAREAGITGAESARTVAAARLVHAHAAIGDGLRRGRLSTAHVAVLARSARDRALLFTRDVEVLVGAAEALPVERFRLVARRWTVCTDDEATGPAADGGPARWLHASPTFAGHVRIDGLLDPEGGAVLLAALAAHLAPRARDDARTPAERRADALVAALGGDRCDIRIDVLTDADTLLGRAPSQLLDARHDLDRLGPVPPSLVRRLAENATISHVAVDADGEIVDIGTARKSMSPRLRRTVELRDEGCTWPGCDRPPEWTDVHHIVAREDGGQNVLSNLRLLCRHHHRLVHWGREPANAPP